jgi:hypothetical protein
LDEKDNNMVNAIHSAQMGMNYATQRVNGAASQLAAQVQSAGGAGSGQPIDPLAAILDLTLAQQQFTANVAVLQTVNQLERHLSGHDGFEGWA